MKRLLPLLVWWLIWNPQEPTEAEYQKMEQEYSVSHIIRPKGTWRAGLGFVLCPYVAAGVYYSWFPDLGYVWYGNGKFGYDKVN